MDIIVNNILENKLKIGNISGLLHDAEFIPADCNYDEQSKVFNMTLERIYYQNGLRSKFLFVFKVWKFPVITSTIQISPVLGIEKKGKFIEEYTEHFQDMETNNDNCIIRADVITLSLKITPETSLRLKDISEPMKKYHQFYGYPPDFLAALKEISEGKVDLDINW